LLLIPWFTRYNTGTQRIHTLLGARDQNESLSSEKNTKLLSGAVRCVSDLNHLCGSYPDPSFHFDADPDPTFHFDAGLDPNYLFFADPDPDPAPHENDANLKLLAYRPSTSPF
jgi:hypothetical protein